MDASTRVNGAHCQTRDAVARERPMRVKIATAGAMSSGKTALIRRFFAEARSAASDGEASAVNDWRATPTVGMDFGTMRIEYDENDISLAVDADDAELSQSSKAIRGCFFDPSGDEAHAPCRREAYRDADGVILVIDANRRASQTELESIIREIVSAPRTDEKNSDPIHVLVVRAKTRSAPSRAALRPTSASILPLQDDDSELALLRHRLQTLSNALANHKPPKGAHGERETPIQFIANPTSSGRSPLADIAVIDTDAASGAGVTRAVRTLAAHIARAKSVSIVS